MFRDRRAAGELLGAALRERVQAPAVVLGIPRGGVIVAGRVAEALGAPLDVVVTHKLGAPGNAELAIGAVAPGVRVVDEASVRYLRVRPDYLDQEVTRQEREIARRIAAYHEGRSGIAPEGRTAVVVDDGVATGATAVAALRWARAAGAARVILAAPVGPAGIESRLASECDDCVVLHTPGNLRAVGEWYASFDQVSDDEVMAVLAGQGA